MIEPTIQYKIQMLDFLVKDIKMSISDLAPKNVTKELFINIQYEVNFSDNVKDMYSIKFNLHLTSEKDSKDDAEFELKVMAESFFKTEQPITEEFKSSDFVQINSPAIAFPYLRSFITTLLSNCGYQTVILPAFNFMQKKIK